jgi:hypothetical protein
LWGCFLAKIRAKRKTGKAKHAIVEVVCEERQYQNPDLQDGRIYKIGAVLSCKSKNRANPDSDGVFKFKHFGGFVR